MQVIKAVYVHLVVCSHALPLVSGLFHGLTEGLGILYHGFELGIGKHPEQVIQDQNQFGGHHVAVLNLCQVDMLVQTCLMQTEVTQELLLMKLETVHLSCEISTSYCIIVNSQPDKVVISV